MFTGIILRKKFWRSDALWTRGIAYLTPLKLFPYLMDRYVLARSQYWPRERLDALIEQRAADLIAGVRHIPYWKKQFSRQAQSSQSAIDYLRALPIMSRATFKALEPAEYCDERLLTTSLKDSTSGSTGTPFVFYLDRASLISSWGIRDRQFLAASRGTRYPVLIFRADGRLCKRFYNARFLYLRGYDDIPERFNALREYVYAHMPEGVVLYMFPSTALALAHHMAASKCALPIRAVVAVGESISQRDCAVIERVLHAPFSLGYGTQESSSIAFECERGQLHINEEDLIVDIVDADGNPARPGDTGRIVITHLGYRVMPFIRYHNGDLGSVSNAPCPCGRTLRTMRVQGRVPILLEQKEGYTVTIAELTTVFNAYALYISAFQIVHTAPDAFHIRVVPGAAFENYRDQMQGDVVRKLHPSSRVSFEEVTRIPASPNGKTPYYVREFTDV